MCGWQFHLPLINHPNSNRHHAEHETHILNDGARLCSGHSIPACEPTGTGVWWWVGGERLPGGPRMESGSWVLVPPVTLGCFPHFGVLFVSRFGTGMVRASGLCALLAPVCNELGIFVPPLDGAWGAALTPHLCLSVSLSVSLHTAEVLAAPLSRF